MAVVFVKSGETIDSALRRFSSMINKEGILFELKKRAYFEKPSEKKKKKLYATKSKQKKKIKKRY